MQFDTYDSPNNNRFNSGTTSNKEIGARFNFIQRGDNIRLYILLWPQYIRWEPEQKQYFLYCTSRRRSFSNVDSLCSLCLIKSYMYSR
jgi:hypothetical protein